MVDKQSQPVTKEDTSTEGATIGHVIEEYLDIGASSPCPLSEPSLYVPLAAAHLVLYRHSPSPLKNLSLTSQQEMASAQPVQLLEQSKIYSNKVVVSY